MDNANESELLKKLTKISEEMHEIIKNEEGLSFVIMARDAREDHGVHMIATGGRRIELMKLVLSFLALGKNQSFIKDAYEMFKNCIEVDVKSEIMRDMNFSTDNKHFN